MKAKCNERMKKTTTQHNGENSHHSIKMRNKGTTLPHCNFLCRREGRRKENRLLPRSGKQAARPSDRRKLLAPRNQDEEKSKVSNTAGRKSAAFGSDDPN